MQATKQYTKPHQNYKKATKQKTYSTQNSVSKSALVLRSVASTPVRRQLPVKLSPEHLSAVNRMQAFISWAAPRASLKTPQLKAVRRQLPVKLSPGGRLYKGWPSLFTWILSFFTEEEDPAVDPEVIALRQTLLDRCRSNFEGKLPPGTYEQLVKQILSDDYISEQGFLRSTAPYSQAFDVFHVLQRECSPNLGVFFNSRSDAWTFYVKHWTYGGSGRYACSGQDPDTKTLHYLIDNTYSVDWPTRAKTSLEGYGFPEFFCDNWVLFFTFIITVGVLLFLYWWKKTRRSAICRARRDKVQEEWVLFKYEFFNLLADTPVMPIVGGTILLAALGFRT